MAPTSSQLKEHFGPSGFVSTWWAEGTVGKLSKRFQSSAQAGACHAGLFGYASPIKNANGHLSDDVCWDFLSSNLFTAITPHASKEIAWEFTNYLFSNQSPWKDIVDTGFEIIEEGGYPRGFLLPNGEALSKLHPLLLFNFVVAARVGTGDGPDVPVNWYNLVNEGIRPDLAHLAATCVKYDKNNVSNRTLLLGHASFTPSTSVTRVLNKNWSIAGTSHTAIWYGPEIGYDNLRLQDNEVERKQTRFSTVSIGKTEAYIERLKGIQNESN